MKTFAVIPSSEPTSTNKPAKPKIHSQKYLINKINYINFQDRTVIINLRHSQFDRTISLPAHPQPCLGNHLDCLWVDPESVPPQLDSFRFDSLDVPDGRKILSVRSEAVSLNERGACLLLPDTCEEGKVRKARRFICTGTSAQIIQNSISFPGHLIEFSAESFRVDIQVAPPQTFRCLNPDLPILILVENELGLVLSAECRLIRQTQGQKQRTLVLEPLPRVGSRFVPKRYRSQRVELIPSPSILFSHPLTGRIVTLKVLDLSGAGLSVLEESENSALVSGMIINELEIRLANFSPIRCKAQVVYKNKEQNAGDSCCRSGIAFIDMQIEDHIKLQALIHQASNKNTYVCNNIDVDSLWNLFFETGFINPGKYQRLVQNKDELKSIFQKLYFESPNIARHFIYEDKGEILGHMSMIRSHSDSWMIHHHAASRSETNRAGVVLLTQIGRSIRDSQTLYSSRMNYVLAYFRSENKFPRRVFGGVANHYKDPKGCSLDPFAYTQFIDSGSTPLPPLWHLEPTSAQDLTETEYYYEKVSGGLLIQALDLEPCFINCKEISDDYAKVGLKKERKLFSLKHINDLKALIIINVADFGLNLSDITSSIQIIIIDQKMPRNVFMTSINLLYNQFNLPKSPVLVYPHHYSETIGLPVDKIYNLWILNCQNLDPYFEFCESLFRQV